MKTMRDNVVAEGASLLARIGAIASHLASPLRISDAAKASRS
jgi:hypothetical protein